MQARTPVSTKYLLLDLDATLVDTPAVCDAPGCVHFMCAVAEQVAPVHVRPGAFALIRWALTKFPVLEVVVYTAATAEYAAQVVALLFGRDAGRIRVLADVSCLDGNKRKRWHIARQKLGLLHPESTHLQHSSLPRLHGKGPTAVAIDDCELNYLDQTPGCLLVVVPAWTRFAYADTVLSQLTRQIDRWLRDGSGLPAHGAVRFQHGAT